MDPIDVDCYTSSDWCSLSDFKLMLFKYNTTSNQSGSGYLGNANQNGTGQLSSSKNTNTNIWS